MPLKKHRQNRITMMMAFRLTSNSRNIRTIHSKLVMILIWIWISSKTLDRTQMMRMYQSQLTARLLSSGTRHQAHSNLPLMQKRDVPKLKKQYVEDLWSLEQSLDYHTGFQFRGPAAGPQGVAHTPIQIFQLFLDSNTIKLIVEKTNWFIFQCDRFKPPRHSQLMRVLSSGRAIIPFDDTSP